MNASTIVLDSPDPDPPKQPPVRRPALDAYQDSVVQARLVITGNGW
jgi:hypothetical protein